MCFGNLLRHRVMFFQPSDRLKTEEELAKDEKEKLEKLEVRRDVITPWLTPC